MTVADAVPLDQLGLGCHEVLLDPHLRKLEGLFEGGLRLRPQTRPVGREKIAHAERGDVGDLCPIITAVSVENTPCDVVLVQLLAEGKRSGGGVCATGSVAWRRTMWHVRWGRAHARWGRAPEGQSRCLGSWRRVVWSRLGANMRNGPHGSAPVRKVAARAAAPLGSPRAQQG
eukprot:scaffold49245_cov28-Tisochrysis_lutea.AAC.2